MIARSTCILSDAKNVRYFAQTDQKSIFFISGNFPDNKLPLLSVFRRCCHYATRETCETPSVVDFLLPRRMTGR